VSSVEWAVGEIGIVCTYAGLGYCGGYLVDYRKELWEIDPPNLRYVDHGLIFERRMCFALETAGGIIGLWVLLFNVYLGLHRVLDFKTFAFTETVLFYPRHWRVCNVWWVH